MNLFITEFHNVLKKYVKNTSPWPNMIFLRLIREAT